MLNRKHHQLEVAVGARFPAKLEVAPDCRTEGRGPAGPGPGPGRGPGVSNLQEGTKSGPWNKWRDRTPCMFEICLSQDK